jgi:putative ABC transport system permease protein
METFLTEVRKVKGIQSAAATSSMVGNRDDVWWEKFNVEGSAEILTTLSMVFDDNFADLIGLTLSEGRMFTKETNDFRNILLNEAAVKVLGLKSPVGKRLSRVIEGSDGKMTSIDFTIIGIVKDFHFQSMRDVVSPLVIFNDKSRKSTCNYVAIRLDGDAANREIGSIETLWHHLLPGRPFKYEFLENFINHLYEREELSRKTFTIFSALAIIIACVGVFGLSAYSASKRIKEIGVRKVLGSSVFQIFILLAKDFTNLVVMAFLVAVPLSWAIMSNWLQHFAYRIDLGLGPFILSGLLAFTIALLTVSYHSIRASMRNPIEALRTE